jgi:hypothetical protein
MTDAASITLMRAGDIMVIPNVFPPFYVAAAQASIENNGQIRGYRLVRFHRMARAKCPSIERFIATSFRPAPRKPHDEAI